MFNWFKKALSVPANTKPANGTTGVPSDGLPVKGDLPNEYAANKKRGNEFLAQGMLEEAAKCYRQAVAVNPGQAEGFLNLGYVLKELKLHEDAEHHLKQAILINPAMADAYYLLGGISQERGNLAGAIESYRKALELKPDFEIVYGDLCRVLFQSGQIESAKKIVTQGLSVNPESAELYCCLGNLFVYEQEPEKAIACYQKSVEIQPDSAAVHSLLGNVFYDDGKLDEAIACYRKALAFNPDSVEANNNLGAIFQALGNLDEAMAYCRRALALNPDSIEANNNLGTTLQALGNFDEAVACYRRALALKPDSVEATNNLGNVFREQGKLDEAEACYRRALYLNPSDAGSHNNLGVLFMDRGDPDEAATCFRNALELESDCTDALNNLGAALKKQGDLSEAAACYRNSAALRPDFHETWNALGNVLREMGNLEAAQACYSRAIELKPDDAGLYNNLGAVFQGRLALDEAASCFSKATELDPHLSVAHSNLGVVFQDQGKLDKALACYRQALVANPEFHAAKMNMVLIMQQICEWDGLERLSEEVRRAIREITSPTAENQIAPFSLLALWGTTPAEQRICAANWARARFQSVISRRKEMGFEFKRERRPKIHIGYLSADFRNHPVAHLMAEVFEIHDREHFQISAYSYGPDDDGVMRKRLEKAFDRFNDIANLTHEDAAQRIFEDQVDILVDLTGYTKYHRSEILALRPAPVQVGYLGFLGTMGADFMDYIIADQFLIPPEHKEYFSEKVAYLPSYQANDRRCAVAETPTRESCGLPEDGIVFCCFNQTYKILPNVFDVWMRLLKAIPGSVFWVYASNKYAIANLQREAQTRGVAPERLIFAEGLPLDRHLARLKCADLFLDTLPYNAGTTASNALWSGLPVITCAGTTLSSRMAGSLLTAMRVPELITYNLEDYYALAFELATDTKKSEAIRNKITENKASAPLFDSAKFTRDLETAYRQMWSEYENSAGLINVSEPSHSALHPPA